MTYFSNSVRWPSKCSAGNVDRNTDAEARMRELSRSYFSNENTPRRFVALQMLIERQLRKDVRFRRLFDFSAYTGIPTRQSRWPMACFT